MLALIHSVAFYVAAMEQGYDTSRGPWTGAKVKPLSSVLWRRRWRTMWATPNDIAPSTILAESDTLALLSTLITSASHVLYLNELSGVTSLPIGDLSIGPWTHRPAR